MEILLEQFIKDLASKKAVPGGGGASALVGSVGAALCSMVANLTSGKQKYAEYQKEIDAILKKTAVLTDRLLGLIEKDAEVFEPLSKAYGLPKDYPGRDDILEENLKNAASVPEEILNEVCSIIIIAERLSDIGTKLAVSDVGVAVSACRSAMESAALNVFINTKLMKDRKIAETVNERVMNTLKDGVERCGAIYKKVSLELI